MQLVVADVLTPEDLSEIRETLAAMRFEDGARTAGWSARFVKDNEQARESATLRLLRERVAGAIRGNALFALAVAAESADAAPVQPLWPRPGLRDAHREPRDRRGAHRRVVHAVPCRSRCLRGRRARDRVGGRRGRAEAARR